MTVHAGVEKQLRRAAAIDDIDTVQKLLSDNPTLDIDATDVVRGQTALEIACVRGNPAVVEYLVAQGANPSHIDQDGLSAIHYACDSEHQNVSLRIVQVLFDRDPDLINKQSHNSSGDTCLHLAARNGNHVLIRWLLEAGVDTAIENATGMTAWDCSQDEVLARAFYSTLRERHRSLDSYSAFVEEEVTTGNARKSLFDITMTKVQNLEVYRLRHVHVRMKLSPASSLDANMIPQTFDIFVRLPEHEDLMDRTADRLGFRFSWRLFPTGTFSSGLASKYVESSVNRSKVPSCKNSESRVASLKLTVTSISLLINILNPLMLSVRKYMVAWKKYLHGNRHKFPHRPPNLLRQVLSPSHRLSRTCAQVQRLRRCFPIIFQLW